MSDNHIGWPTIVTAVVALYGAVLSTVNLLIARMERRKKLHVRLHWGMAPPAVPGREPLTLFFLDATNAGSRPMTLTSAAIVLPDGREVAFPDEMRQITWPHTLAESATCRLVIGAAAVAEVLTRVKLTGVVPLLGSFTDSLGQSYLSKSMHVDVSTVVKAAQES